ncbi:MAG: N-formylglutamate amidohydrolase [Aestuariivirga sp.]|uniref:N-formylglutamate amidohydrolase n=1 Tax=Aestuariivirga sp. TaxID=2650926 RepID=UPI0025BB7814|nr:N-formylglutamate amidohydrolase [Aestuariivirga sp.]MCA3561916.1 N-formylglutamate amidohydrolase [Aestuariivirga sp.]
MDSTARLPPPVRVINAQGSSPYVLLCEHASRFIPDEHKGLGLGEADLTRHIAWDIGAAQVAEALAQALDAPLAMAGYSRLLIDLNRPLDSATSIPEVSETTVIPGNLNLGAEERARRVALYFEPFQAAVRQLLDARLEKGRATVIVGVHSFTPVFKGVARPWHAGVLYRRAQDFGHALAQALGGPGQAIAENQPYQIEDGSDYTVPVHGEARGLDAVLVEIRQDLIGDAAGAATWAARLAAALAAVARS